MPRRRGRPTTVAQAAKPSAAACDVCGQTIKAGEPVAWTWARRRIHEPCMPAWLVSSRRPFGPWVAQAVRLSLDANGGQLCTACLALGFSLNLEESRELATICAGLPGFRVLPVSCDTCRRVGDVLCIVPDRTSCDPDDATSQAAR